MGVLLLLYGLQDGSDSLKLFGHIAGATLAGQLLMPLPHDTSDVGQGQLKATERRVGVPIGTEAPTDPL